MIYDLSDKLDRKRFSEKVKYLWENAVKVELKRKREKRTIPQNAYLHLILSWFGSETGYTLEEVKQDIFKREVCTKFFEVEKNKRKVYRSTKDLTTLELTNAIEFFRNWSVKELGIYLPAPNEEEDLRNLEETLQRTGLAQYV